MENTGSIAFEVQLKVIPLGDSDAAELQDLALELRALILDLDVQSAELVSGEAAPQGAKSVQGLFEGGIVVTAASASLRALLSLAETWVKSRPVRSVKATVNGQSIEVGNASRDDVQQVMARWEAAASRPQTRASEGSAAVTAATVTSAPTQQP